MQEFELYLCIVLKATPLQSIMSMLLSLLPHTFDVQFYYLLWHYLPHRHINPVRCQFEWEVTTPAKDFFLI